MWRALALSCAMSTIYSAAVQAGPLEDAARRYGVAVWARLNCRIEILTPAEREAVENFRKVNRTGFDRLVNKSAAQFNSEQTLDKRYETCERMRKEAAQNRATQ